MAKSYRASQYDSAYIPKLLRNWEIPYFHCEIPVARLGKTQIIANKRGHLLPEIPHPPPTPWGTNLDTWDLPRRITREVAAQLNGMNERKKLIEKCKKRLNQKPIVHGDGQFIKHYDDEEEEDKTPEHLCPIHDIKEVQVLKSLILGEEERGQSQYQVMCFIFYFPKDSFISSDAMAKLRQKNPSAIRLPEEDLGRTNHSMDYVVLLKHAGIISPYIGDLCNEAGLATYTLHEDVVKWATAQGIPLSSYKPALKRFPTSPDRFLTNDLGAEDFLSSCTDMKNMWTPCECHLELCIGWYPCGLKYCKGKSHTKNSVMSYRCGIKTCKICHLFNYYVSQKQQCLWDE